MHASTWLGLKFGFLQFYYRKQERRVRQSEINIIFGVEVEVKKIEFLVNMFNYGKFLMLNSF